MTGKIRTAPSLLRPAPPPPPSQAASHRNPGLHLSVLRSGPPLTNFSRERQHLQFDLGGALQVKGSASEERDQNLAPEQRRAQTI